MESVQLNESREMYLETILLLSRDGKKIRAVDLAKKMNFSRASVSRALLLLENDSLIKRDDGEYISLTPQGKLNAEAVYEKHKVLTTFLTKLGVDKATAEFDACRMEHIISKDSFEAIKKFLVKNA